MMAAKRCQRSGWRRVEDQNGIRRRGERAATRESGGLTISGEGCRWRLIDATAAPSVASRRSATGRERERERAEDDQYRRHFLPLLSLASPCLASLPLPSRSRSLFRFPRSSPPPYSRPSFRLFSIPLNARRSRFSAFLRLSFAPFPCVSLHHHRPPPLRPTLPHPSRCTTRVLTVRRTSAHRGTPRDPLRARASTLPRRRVAPASLSPAVSQAQFSPGDRSVRR